MTNYDKERWFDLYQTALTELEHAAMTGRINDARAEIAVRLEQLRSHPGLHDGEKHAISDALSNLRVLQREEERLAAEERKRLLREAVQSLKVAGPQFGNPGPEGATN